MATTLLDRDNFTINSSAWKVKEDTGIINGKKVSIKIKISPEGDIWEYVSGVPAAYIGQQLFTYGAALRETQKLGKSLPEDQSALEVIIASMPGDTDIQKYKNYLTKAGIQFTGCFSSGSHIFDDLGKRSYYRLADGSRLALNPTTRSVAKRDDTMGYSVSFDT